MYSCGKSIGLAKDRVMFDIIIKTVVDASSITKQSLRYYYIDLQYSMQEMKELTNLSCDKIKFLLNFYEIKIRMLKQSFTTSRRKQKISNSKLISYKENKSTILNKRLKTNLQRFGVEHASSSKQFKDKVTKTWKSKSEEQVGDIVQKRSITNIKKYGVKNVFQSQVIKDKIKQSLMQKYGVDNIMRNEDIKNQMLQRNLQKYGNVCTLYDPEVRKKVNSTKLLKYGSINHQKNPQVIKKQILSYKSNSIKKYGVDHPIKCSELSSRFNTYVTHEYILPSNKIIKLQGYESKTLDQLLLIYAQEDILYQRKDMPDIQYYDPLTEKWHRYYPDFFIPKQNLIIQTKSKYTLEKQAYKNCLKINAVFSNGYNFKLYIH